MTTTTSIVFAVALAVLTSAVHAEYVPDTREFPTAAPLALPAQPALALNGGGAIEFWVEADWTQSPGYHPVILANGQTDRPNYQLSIHAERSALIVQSAEHYGQFDHDFSTGGSHHVAVLGFENRLVAFVNGKLVGSVAMTFQRTPDSGFYIGSGADGRSPFIGAISAVRIWDVPLEPESIATYALRDVNDVNAPHPNLANLLALSDFNNNTVAVVDSFVLAEAELMSRETLARVLGDDELRELDDQFETNLGDGNE